MLVEIRDICWQLSLVLVALWAVQLFRLGLARRYPALMSYLVAAVAVGVGGFLTEHLVASSWLGRSSYFWYWALTQPILWLLLYTVLFECFSRMTEGYEGLRRVGRTVVYGLVGGVVLVTGLVVVLDPFENPDPRFWNSVLLVQQQSVYFSTAGGVLLIFAIRRFFHLPAPRNVSTTLGALGVYVVSIAVMTAIRSYVGASRELNTAMDVAGLGIYCVCLLFGAIAFSRQGERVARDRRFDLPAQETLEAASGRLQDVHEQLVKAVVR